MLAAKENCYPAINFEETELRLGLPGGGDQVGKVETENSNCKCNGKRGFSETEDVDLKLHLSSSSTTTTAKDVGVDGGVKEKAKPPAKAQVVGWPPVRSSRKNITAVQKANTNSDTDKAAATTTTMSSVALVKVSMDGAPYLRKVELKMYNTYLELSHALATMFTPFTIQMKDIITPSKLVDPLNGSEYVTTYEDKDGDWMLIGDVPWEMFVESCKRLRIMKRSEAVGLGELKNERAKAED